MKHKQELFDQPLMCASTNPFLPAAFSAHEGSCMDYRVERNHFKPPFSLRPASTARYIHLPCTREETHVFSFLYWAF